VPAVCCQRVSTRDFDFVSKQSLNDVWVQPDTAVIRVYNEAGNVMEVHRHKGDFKEPRPSATTSLVPNKTISTIGNCQSFLQFLISFTDFRYLASVEYFVMS
jgi:hypothetical protein